MASGFYVNPSNFVGFNKCPITVAEHFPHGNAFLVTQGQRKGSVFFDHTLRESISA